MAVVTLKDLTAALIAALKTEGSTGAPWNQNVTFYTSSQLVELSGNPKSKTWPWLGLFGPKLTENKNKRQQKTVERVAVDNNAGTADVRPWPRFFDVEYNVIFECRVGSTPAGVTASEQFLDGIDRWNSWVERVRSVSGLWLVSVEDMTTSQRVTPADIMSATATIKILDKPTHSVVGLTTKPTTKQFEVNTALKP